MTSTPIWEDSGPFAPATCCLVITLWAVITYRLFSHFSGGTIRLGFYVKYPDFKHKPKHWIGLIWFCVEFGHVCGKCEFWGWGVGENSLCWETMKIQSRIGRRCLWKSEGGFELGVVTVTISPLPELHVQHAVLNHWLTCPYLPLSSPVRQCRRCSLQVSHVFVFLTFLIDRMWKRWESWRFDQIPNLVSFRDFVFF